MEPTIANFADLLDEYTLEMPQRGQIVTGEILKIEDDIIMMDIGAKRDALVPPHEIKRLGEEFLQSLSRGDELPVYVLKTADEKHDLEVSIDRGLEQQDWERAYKLLTEEESCHLNFIAYNKGGMIVQFGRLRGFVPASHVTSLLPLNDSRQIQAQKAKLVGEESKFKVIEVNQKMDRLLLSERKAQEELSAQRLKELEAGDIVDGTVTGIKKYGAFVDLGDGVRGLIHVSELAWEFVEHPRDILQRGDDVKVKIVSIDEKRKRVALSRKALLPSPWDNFVQQYNVGDLIDGRVTSTVDFGAFVEVFPSIEGLIHNSEMLAAAAVAEGDEVLVRIIDIDHELQQIALSMNQVTYEEQVQWMQDRSSIDKEAEEAAAEEAAAEEAATEEDVAEEQVEEPVEEVTAEVEESVVPDAEAPMTTDVA